MAEPLPRGGQSLTRAGVALVSFDDGSIGGDATGLFARDRRMVRTLAIDFTNVRSELLSVARTGAGADRLLYGLFADGRDPIALVERYRTIGKNYTESLTVQSFVDELAVDIEVHVAAGGATVYGLDRPEPTPDAIAWLGGALDEGSFERHDDGPGTYTLRATVSLSQGQATTLDLSVDFAATVPPPVSSATVRSNDPRLDHIFRTSERDLEALRIVDPASGTAFLAAGAPHFLAAFGRDALIANLLAIATSTDRALNTLRVLAHHQGAAHDAVTLEEPGRIAHELRVGDMGVFGVPPGTPYYGSIDASPLFVVLLQACWHWGATADAICELLPAARRAVGWCRTHVDDHGFVYSAAHASGPGNQGWKDSADSMVRADGSIVSGQTSPAEVQGYVHEAFMALADLEAQLGDPNHAHALHTEAADLAARFDRHFCVVSPTEVALALDGDGTPLVVRSSNVGHLLDSGLIGDELAAKLADRLMSPDEFSGWGVRTLAASEAAYKPFGYHLGTVWPHDNALILRGLIRRGFTNHARTLIDALLDLATARDGQLPELISGLAREGSTAPVPYLSSARPQAWAAAVPLQIATALVGLQANAPASTLSYHSLLRPYEHLVIEDIALGDRTITIEAKGSMVAVTGDVAGLRVVAQT